MLGDGALVNFIDIESDYEEEFNEWYNYEHVDDLIHLPGWTRGRRFRNADGQSTYLAFYEAEAIGRFAEPVYLDLLANLSPWTRKSISHIERHSRIVARRSAGAFHGDAGAMAMVRFVASGDLERLRRRVAGTLFPDLAAGKGRLGAVLLEMDADITAAPRRSRGAAPHPSDTIDGQTWIIAAQAMDVSHVRMALAEILAYEPLQAVDIVSSGAFGFLYGRTKEPFFARE